MKKFWVKYSTNKGVIVETRCTAFSTLEAEIIIEKNAFNLKEIINIEEI